MISADIEKMARFAKQSGAGIIMWREKCLAEGWVSQGGKVCYRCFLPKPVDAFVKGENICLVCHSEVTGEGHAREQDASLDHASNRGEPWTSEDEKYLLDHLDQTDAQLAKALHRTMYAIGKRLRYLEARKRGYVPPSLPAPTEFGEVRNQRIQRITIEPVETDEGVRLVVFCPLKTPPEAVREEFLANGRTEDEYVEWLARARRLM